MQNPHTSRFASAPDPLPGLVQKLRYGNLTCNLPGLPQWYKFGMHLGRSSQKLEYSSPPYSSIYKHLFCLGWLIIIDFTKALSAEISP